MHAVAFLSRAVSFLRLAPLLIGLQTMIKKERFSDWLRAAEACVTYKRFVPNVESFFNGKRYKNSSSIKDEMISLRLQLSRETLWISVKVKCVACIRQVTNPNPFNWVTAFRDQWWLQLLNSAGISLIQSTTIHKQQVLSQTSHLQVRLVYYSKYWEIAHEKLDRLVTHDIFLSSTVHRS